MKLSCSWGITEIQKNHIITFKSRHQVPNLSLNLSQGKLPIVTTPQIGMLLLLTAQLVTSSMHIYWLVGLFVFWGFFFCFLLHSFQSLNESVSLLYCYLIIGIENHKIKEIPTAKSLGIIYHIIFSSTMRFKHEQFFKGIKNKK